MKNFSRIAIGALMAIVFLSILLSLVERTTLVWTAFAWSIWAIVVFAISMGFWATSNRNSYFLNAAFPMVVRGYMVTTLVIAFLFVFFEKIGAFSLKYGWFCLIEFGVLMIYAWRFQAMDVAREEINNVDNQVKVKTVNWKLIVADIMAIAEKSSAPDRALIFNIAELIRYADPMEHELVSDVVQKIRLQVNELDVAVAEKNSDKITEICRSLELLCNERTNKLLLFK